MSTFSQQTKHPVTGKWHNATWMDDFYGRHRYGVRFPNGETFNPDKIQLETREDEPLESTMKERFEDAYQRFQLCDEVSAPEMKKLWAFIEKEIAIAIAEERKRVEKIPYPSHPDKNKIKLEAIFKNNTVNYELGFIHGRLAMRVAVLNKPLTDKK